MEKAAAYHRDIYSGMVASELAKAGYFGDEYRLYGFLYWIDNEKNFITAEKDEECAKAYADLIERGALVTPYISLGERLYEPVKIEATMVALKRKIYTILNKMYGKELEKQIIEYKQIVTNSDVNSILQNYYSSFNEPAKRERVQALKWMAGYTKKNGLLSQENYNNLIGLLPEIKIQSGDYFKEISGFAWRDADGWKYYVNAFLPTVVERLICLQKEGYLTSGIVSKKYCLGSKSAYELKAEFQRYLRTILDNAYLNMVCTLDEMVKQREYY
jgi:hypothetical protein